MTQKKVVKEEFASGAGSKEQDLFAKNVANGMPLREAFTKAGYKGVNKDRPKKLAMQIKDVIMYYRRELEKKVNITTDEILYNQACIATYDIVDMIDLETGEVLPPHELPQKLRRAIKKMSHTTRPDGTITWHYEFGDKLRALNDLAALKQAVLAAKSGGRKLKIDYKGIENG